MTTYIKNRYSLFDFELDGSHFDVLFLFDTYYLGKRLHNNFGYGGAVFEFREITTNNSLLPSYNKQLKENIILYRNALNFAIKHMNLL